MMKNKDTDTENIADDKTRIANKFDERARTPSQPNISTPSSNTEKTVLKKNDKTRIAPQRKNRKPSKLDDDLVFNNHLPIDENQYSHPVDTASQPTEKIINNRFVIKRSLGVGGMGAVFRALDLRKQETHDTEPYIAIKILSNEFKEHPQAFISLQREAKKSQILSHPNVIKVYDFDRDGDLVYLTMEELKGKPLNQLIKDYGQGLPQEMAIQIIQAISEGLAYAHKKNIVHADLKPDNVFYTDDGEVKIIDFGIAKIITDLDSVQHDDSEISGLTPAYASLEMFNDESVVPSDDIYALGIIAYELLTGEHPFNRESADAAFNKGLTYKKIPKLKSYQWKAINKALFYERKNRLKNGTEFFDLFTGKGRHVRQLSIGLITVSIIFAISLLIPREQNMDHLYDELAPKQQQAYNEFIKQGTILLGFNDWNNALAQFEQAHGILPQHSRTNEALNSAVEKILINLGESSPELTNEVKLSQINELLKYRSLADNQLLLEYKARIKK
ncbi:serine/threonine-protein kinase [Aliikangiella sp. IMCC44359]|uniref:serine/threonine-protein kinase n=1 Tax=Aliikangiella sp. IMCC44359 TaxID=3459125 RepID=UPI00403B2568